MPAFCARWPDGSFSIVDADDETHARIQLDEFGDEPAELWPMESCLLDFDLADDGTFRFKQFGEQTGPEILAKGYPVLNRWHGWEDRLACSSRGRAGDQKRSLSYTYAPLIPTATAREAGEWCMRRPHGLRGWTVHLRKIDVGPSH